GFGGGPPSSPSLYDAARADELLASQRDGDVRDLEAVSACIAAAEPEVLIHMAAQSLVRRSYEDPVGTYSVNVLGTATVLEAARSAPGLRVALIATSDKCYRLPADG